MTRSKLKEVVERGVVSRPSVCVCVSECVCVLYFSFCPSLLVQVIPAWNISPIKKPSDVRKVSKPGSWFQITPDLGGFLGDQCDWCSFGVSVDESVL